MHSFTVSLFLFTFLAACYGAPGRFRLPRPHYFLREYQEEKRGRRDVDVDACLKAHNEKRALHKAPPLVWDATLARHAQSWANHLANEVGHMEHAQGTGEGENLYWSMGSAVAKCVDAVKAWYNEEPDYPFNKPPHTSKEFFAPKQFGHFTQEVWKATKKIGLAIATKPKNGMTETYIVARYSPPGNMLGEFETNVARPGK